MARRGGVTSPVRCGGSPVRAGFTPASYERWFELKKYLILIKSSMMVNMVYRVNILLGLVTNILYLFLSYYFWKAVFFQADKINGMTFEQVLVYIIFASLIAASINSGVEGNLTGLIYSGDIVYYLARPLNFQLRVLFSDIGSLAFKFLYFTFPMVTVFLVAFKTEIGLGMNIPVFLTALVFSYLINFLISFMMGLLGFYTQSAWGVYALKNFMVSLFSGALIPLDFFPKTLKQIAFILPFHTIINTPMKLITANEFSGAVAFNYLIQQSLWAIALLAISVILFKRLINTLIVNGG
jgi:ABC-2 type transport system permease protein